MKNPFILNLNKIFNQFLRIYLNLSSLDNKMKMIKDVSYLKKFINYFKKLFSYYTIFNFIEVSPRLINKERT